MMTISSQVCRIGTIPTHVRNNIGVILGNMLLLRWYAHFHRAVGGMAGRPLDRHSTIDMAQAMDC